MKKYYCLCGEGFKTLGKLNHHIHVRSSRDGKGKHKSLKAPPVLNHEERLNEQELKHYEETVLAMAAKRTAKVAEPPKETKPPVEQVEVKAKVEPKPKPPSSGRRWWLVLLGLVLIIVGGAVSYYGNSKTQSALIVAGLLGIVPGGYLVFQGFKKREPELPAVDVAGKEVATKPTGKENCLNIYPREKGGIRFEYMNKPPFGLSQQCINNGKKYFVNIWKPEENQLVPLIFQDQKYEDPRVLAEVVEADPVRRYFEISIPLLEKIAPWAFVAAIGLALLAIIILPGVLKG